MGTAVLRPTEIVPIREVDARRLVVDELSKKLTDMSSGKIEFPRYKSDLMRLPPEIMIMLEARKQTKKQFEAYQLAELVLPVAAGLRKVACADNFVLLGMANELGFNNLMDFIFLEKNRNFVETHFKAFIELEGYKNGVEPLLAYDIARKCSLGAYVESIETKSLGRVLTQIVFASLLGYPKCCVKHYFDTRDTQADLCARRVRASKWPPGVMDYYSPLLPWFACSMECSASDEYIEKMRSLMAVSGIRTTEELIGDTPRPVLKGLLKNIGLWDLD